MKRVAVLGANGFFGTRLVEMLHLAAEAHVVPVAHSVSGLARVARFALEWRIADATDPAALKTAFSGCEVVVHAIAGSLDSIVRSPRATLEACKAVGVRRVIYISTASVHGQDVAPGTDERSPLHTRHLVPYNNAKVVAERAFVAQHVAFGIELVVLRPGIVFGPRDVWVTGIARSLIDRNAALVAGGVGWCNTIYVDNLVHAVRCAMTANANGEVFLVGDAEAITWHDLYARVASAMGLELTVASVPAPPMRPAGFDSIEAVKSLPGVQRLLDHTPKAPKAWARRQAEAIVRVRQAVRSAYRGPEIDPWRARPANVPGVSVETAMLHSCRHRFTYEKARSGLGFVPPVPLDAAIERTAGWLEFIGYARGR
jgi:2-alkyl-3-oxoalkanoate reductase